MYFCVRASVYLFVCVCLYVCVFLGGLMGAILPLQESNGLLHCPSYRDALESLGIIQTQWLSCMSVYVCVQCVFIVSILQSRPGDQV